MWQIVQNLAKWKTEKIFEWSNEEFCDQHVKSAIIHRIYKTAVTLIISELQ